MFDVRVSGLFQANVRLRPSSSYRSSIDGTGARFLANLLRNPRYEILPVSGVAEAVVAHVPRDVTVTITSSPRRGLEPTLTVAEELHSCGYKVVPHVAARLVRDRDHLVEIVGRIGRIGGGAFVITGDSTRGGAYADSFALLLAIAAEGANFSAGIAGYPQTRNQTSADADLRALFEKQPLASYIVSNLCFSPAPVADWVARIRGAGVSLPVYVGIAGVTEPAKLIRIAGRIGIPDSARFLRSHGNWLVGLARPRPYSPTDFIKGLAPSLRNSVAGVVGLHVYTFNELGPTEAWRQQLLQAHLPERTT